MFRKILYIVRWLVHVLTAFIMFYFLPVLAIPIYTLIFIVKVNNETSTIYEVV